MTGERRARPVVLSAPSGAGKTTIGRQLVLESPDFVFCVSATTRAPRPNERDGVDYDFATASEFKRMIDAGELVEWAEVHGKMYGTPRANLDAARSGGHHVVLDIDVQGARQIRETVPEAVQIFILPPSGRALVDRLTARGTEGRREMNRRLRNAKEELAEALDFDHAVVNDDLLTAVQDVQALIRGEVPSRSAGALEPLLHRLQGEIDRYIEREHGDGFSPEG